MEELTTCFVIACSSYSLMFLKDMLSSGRWFNGRLVDWLVEVLSVKPFGCPVCLSIWIGLGYALTIDLEFIYLLMVAPILVEGIDRHLRSGF